MTKVPDRLNTDGGGIIRYAYCDPAFILGTPMAMADGKYVDISAQSRWQGVIFAGEGDGRIVPIPKPNDLRVSMNAFGSVQSRGTLVTQMLKNSRCDDMIVWLSREGLGKPVEEDGIVFVEAAGAYAAIRVTRGGFRWMQGDNETARPIRNGLEMILKEAYAPVIVEVMAKREIENFEKFKAKVKACTVGFDGPVLNYTTIYGDTLTFDTSHKQTQTLNGKPVNFAPGKVFDSPFLQSDYNSGIVTIRKGSREKVLDFNQSVKDQ
ncbi:MAG: hypothetical protein GC164_06110 [Phycisphaera sp.]|nr:hypothetical protein [Phycisphaera sp.]